MTAPVQTAPTTTSAEILAQIYSDNVPFFASHVQFVSEKGDYRCLFCEQTVTTTDDVAITYANRVRFAHTTCLRALPLVANISTDKKARAAAIAAAKLRRKAEQAANRPTISKDALRAEFETELRAQIEQEYDEAIDRAMTLITSQRDQIAELTEELRLAKADYTAIYEASTESARRRAALISK